jgi:hypothetical protein
MAYSAQDIVELDFLNQAVVNRDACYTPRAISASFQVIPIPQGTAPELERAIHRVNALGSLFYFSTVVLHKNKFQRNPDKYKNLHLQMCLVVEKDGLQEVIEIPRDHYKSSVYSECLPMWRTLPFLDSDEIIFRALGYSDEFVLWMKRAHQQDFRWLLCSEVTKNAAKLGKRISNHYESNNLFKHLFPEIIPDSSDTWNNLSLTHKRTAAGKGQGEGTYDFIGVGSALQSTHYDGCIQDDLVGRAAFESPSVLEDTIEYHKLLIGAMDQEVSHESAGLGQRENDEVIVGNRWAYNDLNSYIRENEDYFNFTTHSALGGCCPLHPYGTPIFPEAFSIQKLEKYKKRLGNYLFSCQFLNVPINPSEVKLRKSNLRYYELVRDTSGAVSGKKNRRVLIRHHVNEGDVIADVFPRNLKRFITIDPNHSENDGRCRHAIAVTGVNEDPRRAYLLDVWAKACGIPEFIETAFRMAFAWKVPEIHLETIAAQRYLKYHLDWLIKTDAAYNIIFNQDTGEKIPVDFVRSMKITELKTPKTKNAKQMRIDAIGPVTERHELWINTHGQNEFLEEFETYPMGKLRDVLDVMGYAITIWPFDQDSEDIEDEILRRKARYVRDSAVRPY